MALVSIGQAIAATKDAVTAQTAEHSAVVAAAAASQPPASTAPAAGVPAATPDGGSGDRPA